MSITRMFQYALIGATMGFLLAFIGLLVKYRRMLKHGIFVETINLHRNETLTNLIRQVRPYCQTSRYGVHQKYKKFIAMADDLVGVVIQRRQNQQCNYEQFTSPDYLSTAMNFLNSGVVKKQIDRAKLKAVELALTELIRTL